MGLGEKSDLQTHNATYCHLKKSTPQFSHKKLILPDSEGRKRIQEEYILNLFWQDVFLNSLSNIFPERLKRYFPEINVSLAALSTIAFSAPIML